MARVLHISKYLPGFYGGLEQVMTAMAKVASSDGFEVSIAGVMSKTGMRAPRAAWREVALAARWQIGAVALAPGYFALDAELARADIVHVHMPHPLAELSVLRYVWSRDKTAALPKIVPVLHAGIFRVRPLGALWEMTVAKALLKLADRVVVAAPQNIPEWMHKSGVAGKCSVLPFPVEDPGPGGVAPKKGVHLVALGRLVPYKGFDLLIKALVGVQGDWCLSIVGAGPQMESLVNLASSLHERGRVHFLGAVTEDAKDQILRSADILIAPSRTKAEAYGISIAEAMSYGLPVITTDLGSGVAFLARDGACGAMVRAGSVASLRAGLQRMLISERSRVLSGVSNRRFFEEYLTPEKFRDNYLELLRQIIYLEEGKSSAIVTDMPHQRQAG